MTQYAQTVYCSHTYYVKAVRNECILSDLNCHLYHIYADCLVQHDYRI